MLVKVITLATQKGGSGKSQLASSLIVAALADGLRVVALDTDPQETLFKWGRRRNLNEPIVHACKPHQLASTIAKLKTGHDLIFVDTPGADNTDLGPSIEVADFCLVPVKPTLDDMEAAVPTAKQLTQRKKSFGFVLSQCTGNIARLHDASAALLRYGEVAACNIHVRVDYPDASAAGQGVTEYNPKGPAAKEILLLWAWLRRAAGVPQA